MKSPARAPDRSYETSRRRFAERCDRNCEGPRRRDRVAAEQGRAECTRILCKPARKRLEPIVRPVGRKRQGQQKSERLRALGGEIG